MRLETSYQKFVGVMSAGEGASLVRYMWMFQIHNLQSTRWTEITVVVT